MISKERNHYTKREMNYKHKVTRRNMTITLDYLVPIKRKLSEIHIIKSISSKSKKEISISTNQYQYL